MAVSLNFKDKSYVYTSSRYQREIDNFLKHSLEGINCSIFHYFSKTSESVYVVVKPISMVGYILFAIKGHKMSNPSSLKVFSTLNYTNFLQLGLSVRSYVENCIEGKNSSFRFKYGNYLGIRTILGISKQGYRIVCSDQDYFKNIEGKVNLVKGAERVLVKDSVFVSRLEKLLSIGLVRGYSLGDNRIQYYITEIGFTLYSLERSNYELKYLSDTENNSLEGLLEDELKQKL